MITKIQLRRDTTANWETNNPILSSGEIGIDTDINSFKIGNGTDAWNDLEYFSGQIEQDIEIFNPTGALQYPSSLKGNRYIVNFDPSEITEEAEVQIVEEWEAVDSGLIFTEENLLKANIWIDDELVVENGLPLEGYDYYIDEEYAYVFGVDEEGSYNDVIGVHFVIDSTWGENGEIAEWDEGLLPKVKIEIPTSLDYSPGDMLLCLEDTVENNKESWYVFQAAITGEERKQVNHAVAHLEDFENPHEVTSDQVNANSKEDSFNRNELVNFYNFMDFIKKQENLIKDETTEKKYVGKFSLDNGIPIINMEEYNYEKYAKDIYKLSNHFIDSFDAAWAHSLIVDTETIENTDGWLDIEYLNKNTEGVIIPNGVEEVYWNSLSSNYTPLKNFNAPLVFPKTLKKIEDWAFFRCLINTHPLILPDGLLEVGIQALGDWILNNHPLIIPDTVESLGGGAFEGWISNNHPLIISKNLTEIPFFSFRRWENNNHPLIIPNGVTTIGDGAFSDWISNKHPLIIPSSVNNIGHRAFNRWEKVPYIEIQSIVPPTIAGGSWGSFNNQNDAPIYVPDESVEAYKTTGGWASYAERIFGIGEKYGSGQE